MLKVFQESFDEFIDLHSRKCGRRKRDIIIGNKQNKLLTNSLLNLFGNSTILFSSLIFSYVLAFLSRIILARYLTPTSYGIYSLGLTIMSFIMPFSILSISISLSRYIPIFKQQNNEKRLRGIIFSSIGLTILLSLITTCVLIFLSPMIQSIYKIESLSNVIIIFSISILSNAIILIIGSIFQGFNKTKPTALFKNIIWNILKFVFFIICIFLSYSLISFIWSYSIALILTSVTFIIYFIIYIKKHIDMEGEWTNEIKLLLFFSTPLFFSLLLWNIAEQINFIMLSIYRPAYEIGIYSTAIILPSLLSFLVEAITYVYLPLFSSLINNKYKKERNMIFQITTKWLIILSLPITIFLCIYSKELIIYFFGTEYQLGAFVMIILAVSYFINIIGILGRYSLIALGKTILCLKISILITIILIINGIILIPLYGMNGAIVSLLFTYIPFTLLNIYYFNKNGGISPFTKQLVKPIICYLLCASIFYYILFSINIRINTFFLIFSFIFFNILMIIISLKTGIEQLDIELLNIIGIDKRFRLIIRIIKKLITL